MAWMTVRCVLITFILFDQVQAFQIREQPRVLTRQVKPYANPESEEYDLETEYSKEDQKSRDKMLQNSLRGRSDVKEPVLFEPLQEVRLSLSTYQITSVFSFAPYKNSINGLIDYALSLRKDLAGFISEGEKAIAAPQNGLFSQLYAEQAAIEAELKLIFQMEMEFYNTIDLMKPKNERRNDTRQERFLPRVATTKKNIKPLGGQEFEQSLAKARRACMSDFITCANHLCMDGPYKTGDKGLACKVAYVSCYHHTDPPGFTDFIPESCFTRFLVRAKWLKPTKYPYSYCSWGDPLPLSLAPTVLDLNPSDIGNMTRCIAHWEMDRDYSAQGTTGAPAWIGLWALGQALLGWKPNTDSEWVDDQLIRKETEGRRPNPQDFGTVNDQMRRHGFTSNDPASRDFFLTNYQQNVRTKRESSPLRKPPTDFLNRKGNLRHDTIKAFYETLRQECQDGNPAIWNERPDICEQEFGLSPRRREKRFIGAILGAVGVLGAGAALIFSGHAIGQLKKRMKVLEQHTRDNRRAIMGNQRMINLTRMELGEHRKLLTKLDAFTIQMNNTMTLLISHVQFSERVTVSLHSVKTKMDLIRSGRETIRHDLGLLYQYLNALSTQQLSPTLINPVDLREILLHAKEVLRSHPRLKLPVDPRDKLWEYYTYLKIVPVVLDDHLIVVLQIPLVDLSTTFQIYQIYNLPALNPQLRVTFQYVLESQYLVVSSNLHYFMLPQESDVWACRLTRGHWCRLKTAMYPVSTVKWCVASLFQNKKRDIEKNCKVRLRKKAENVAYDLGKGLWAISALEETHVKIKCLESDNYITISPPFQVIHLKNGCEATSTGVFYIPASTTIEVEVSQDEVMGKRFLGFQETYVPLTQWHAFENLTFPQLTPEQVNKLTTHLSEDDEIPMPDMIKQFDKLDPSIYEEGFFSWDKIKTWVIIGVVGTVLLLVLFLVLWCALRRKAGKAMVPDKIYDKLPARLQYERTQIEKVKKPKTVITKDKKVKFATNEESVSFEPDEGTPLSVFDRERQPIPSTSRRTISPKAKRRSAPKSTIFKYLIREAKEDIEAARIRKQKAKSLGIPPEEYESDYEEAKTSAYKKAQRARMREQESAL